MELEELYDRKREIMAELDFIEDQIIGAKKFEEYERLEAEEKEMSYLVDRVNSEVFAPMEMEMEIKDVLNKTLDIIDSKYNGDYSIDKYFQDLRNVNI